MFEEDPELDSATAFLSTHMEKAISVGLLRVVIARGLPDWHAPIAKNTAHVAGSSIDFNLNVRSDITHGSRKRFLVNLDCDNYLSILFFGALVTVSQTAPNKRLNHLDISGQG